MLETFASADTLPFSAVFVAVFAKHWGIPAAAFLAGVVDAMAGGGGLISVPAFMAAGVPFPFLLGTNKCMAGTGSLVAVFRYARGGLMPVLSRRTWMSIVGLSALFSALGAWISQLSFVLDRLRLIVPLLLMLVMVFLVKRWFFESRKVDMKPRAVPMLTAGRTLFLGGVGGYDGLLGPGAGTFFLSALESFGFETVRANALTKVLNLASNLGALILFAGAGRILWPVGLAAGLTFMAGNYLGTGMVLKRGQKLVRGAVVVSTSLMLLKHLWVG